MTYKFTPEQEAWLRDLETTEEPQTKGALHRVRADAVNPVGYCCLGRACVVLGIEERTSDDGYAYSTFGEDAWQDAWLPKQGIKTLRLRGSGGEFEEPFGKFSNLADMNDSGWPFKKIAAYIRENPENVFLPPEEETE